MRQVILRAGAVIVEEVPDPVALPGQVLVRVAFSCLSPGTELNSMARGAHRVLGVVLA